MTDGTRDPDARLIPWETFHSTFMDPAVGADVPVEGDPRLVIFVAPGARRLGLRMPQQAGVVPRSGLNAIRLTEEGGHLVLSTEDPQLYQAFYSLLLDISDRIQIAGSDVLQAIDDALRVWRRLLAGLGGLTHEEQVGLSGELWALIRLMRVKGPEMVENWTGPAKEAHDFRLGEDELEVKTTSGARRRHRITRLDQLEPSPGKTLHILSLQIARAGSLSGWTLAEQVAEVRDLIGDDGGLRSRLRDLLTLARWSDEDAHLYPDRWQLRAEPRIVPVDAACPRITRRVLIHALGDISGRIDEVSYTVSLENLGWPDGTQEFEAVVPGQ